MSRLSAPSRIAFAVAAALLLSSAALAGDLHLAWDASPGATGYRVYYGTAPGSYPQSVDVGNVTETTLTTLGDCTEWYFAVTAYNDAGESGYSNEVASWPRPIVTSTSPSAAEQGRRLDVAINGTNFRTGSTVAFSAAGVTVNGSTIGSCTQIVSDVSVGASATVGASNVSVTHPNGVTGTGAGVFTVQAAVPPTVQSTSPVDGATGVSVAVHPTVTFSEAMDPASVTASTVRLLDSGGAAVAQAAGSPALSANGTVATITPAASLAQGATYKIDVVGGTSGVKDLAGHGMTSGFRQSTGFSTVGDTTAPAISNVQSSQVAGTSAQITWTTNEASDSRVEYRKSGTSAYQSTTLDATAVTSHSVALQGLAPQTAYQYHVVSSDAAGNTSTSSPDDTFTTTSSPYAYLRFEAEAGTLVSPMRRSSGTGVFGEAYVDTPAGSNGTANSPAGTATFGVNLPSAGTWYLWVRMYGPGSSSNAMFESVDGGSRAAMTATPTGSWVWIAGRSYSLSTGQHSVELGGNEAQARADRILLTNDPGFVPTEQAVGDVQPTQPVSAFTGSAGDARVDLAWTNPADGDFVRTVIRYRTDGKYPTSPVDGLAVADRPASPGTNDAFAHTGLTNGVTYSYSAFAIDASGNVADRATAQATPQPTPQPPPAPGNLRVTP